MSLTFAVAALAFMLCIAVVPTEDSDAATLGSSDITYSSETGFTLQFHDYADIVGDRVRVNVSGAGYNFMGTIGEDGSVVCTSSTGAVLSNGPYSLAVTVPGSFSQSGIQITVVTVTFNPNGGDGDLKTVTMSTGSNILPSYDWSKGDNPILGWATTSDATEPEFQLGGLYTVPADGDTLYAVYGNVEEPTVTGIEVTELPTKTQYIVGETLDLTGLVVTASYSDESDKPVTGYTVSPAAGSVLNTAGTVKVTVTYEGMTTEFTITVNEKEPEPVTLTGIQVTELPTKTQYFTGETLDLTGLVVTASYDGESSKPVTGYMVSPEAGSVLNEAGTVTVTVTYTEGDVTQTATFEVTVSEKAEVVLEGIKVTTPPTKTEYFVGDEFDPAGMVVTATYSDESTRSVTGYDVSVDMSAAGDVTATVTYSEGDVTVDTTFTVTVKAVEEVGVEIDPVKDVYTVGDEFDATVTVYVVYNNDDRKQVTEGYEVAFTQGGQPVIDGQVLEATGKIVATVTYGEFSDSSEITVKAPGQVVIDISVLGGGTFGTLVLEIDGKPMEFTSKDSVVVKEGAVIKVSYQSDLVLNPTLTIDGKAVQKGHTFTADSDCRIMVSFIVDDDDDQPVNPPVVPKDDDDTTYIVAIAAAAVVAVLAAIVLMQSRKS